MVTEDRDDRMHICIPEYPVPQYLNDESASSSCRNDEGKDDD